jgi:hypothetical protein
VNVGDAKSSFAADAADALQSLDKQPFFAIVERFGGDKSNSFRDGHKEWNRIDEHDVNAQHDVATMFHDFFWQVVRDSAENCLQLLSGDFPF